MEKVDYETLIGEMKTHDTTNGWDVVVSYDEDKINKLLKAKTDEGSLQLPEMKVPYEDLETGEKKWATYRLKLSSPSLQLEESSGRAVLTYTLSGEIGAAKRPVAEGLQMLVTVDIARLGGSVTKEGGTSGFKPQPKDLHPDPEKAKTQGPNHVVDTSSSEAHGICIVFREATVDVVSQDEKNRPLANTLRTAIRDSTEDHLHKSEFNYFLSGVNTQASGSEGNDTLRPTKFCFTIVPGYQPTKQPGALMMWIAVEGGSGDGKLSDGQTSVTFHPDQSDRNPIPKGNSASVIFRHDLIAKKLLQPTLEKKFDDVRIVSQKGTEGMKLAGKMKDVRVYVPKVHYSKRIGIVIYQKSLDSVDFKTSDPETTITVDSSLGSDDKRLTLAYTSPVQKNKEWVDGVAGNLGPPHGMTDLVFKWSASGKWEGTKKEDKPNMLTVSFSKNNPWVVEATGQEPPWWSAKASSSVPDEYKNLKLNLDVDIEMGSLDYFLTTNLLFPGKHIFLADDPAADSTKSHGLAVPRDVILTGQVADHL